MVNRFSKIEVFHDDGWKEIAIEHLKKDDVFRMFGSDSELIGDGKEYIALEYPCPIHDSWNIWAKPANEPQLVSFQEDK